MNYLVVSLSKATSFAYMLVGVGISFREIAVLHLRFITINVFTVLYTDIILMNSFHPEIV